MLDACMLYHPALCRDVTPYDPPCCGIVPCMCTCSCSDVHESRIFVKIKSYPPSGGHRAPVSTIIPPIQSLLVSCKLPWSGEDLRLRARIATQSDQKSTPPFSQRLKRQSRAIPKAFYRSSTGSTPDRHSMPRLPRCDRPSLDRPVRLAARGLSRLIP